MDSIVEAVKQLHKPDDYYPDDCECCSAYSWPCATAELVYSKEEIEETLAIIEAERQLRIDANNKKKEARRKEIEAGSPLTMAEQIAKIYEPLLMQQLSEQTIFRATGKYVSFPIRNDIKDTE